jgi:hypothetical protein
MTLPFQSRLTWLIRRRRERRPYRDAFFADPVAVEDDYRRLKGTH